MQLPAENGFSLGRVGARAVLWLLASSMSACAVGQDVIPDAADDSDQPEEIAPERVARLSFTQGRVSLQAVGETTWAPATLNRPLTPGDFLRTENDGRAEIQVDTADVRMGAGTSFGFTTLDDNAMRLRLSTGVLNLRVRTLSENESIEVETPQATAAIVRPGSYRIEVNPDASATVVKVSSGMLEARGSGNQSYIVRAQQVATLMGSSQLAFSTATLGPPDAFDQWALERDRRDDYVLSTEPAKNMPSDIVGYEDLEQYGQWTSEPEYGYVWTPSYVAAGWSPYRYGRYTYVSGWGWAWIDDAPWGFAPYHYGRWVTIGSRWSWVPGPRHGRPVGRPIGGTPVVGRPEGSHHGWHVPRPPRGYTVRSGVPASDVTRIGTRPGGPQNGGRTYRTQPDSTPSPVVRTPRYVVPANPREDVRAGSGYTPPARVGVPRQDGGRYSRGTTTSPSTQPARPAYTPPAQQPRPTYTPPQQSRPVQSQPAPSPRPAPSSSAGPRAPKVDRER